MSQPDPEELDAPEKVPHDFNRCHCPQVGRCLVHCATCHCGEPGRHSYDARKGVSVWVPA